MSNDHDQALARAFDVQAPRFERAPVQSDPAALERLVRSEQRSSGRGKSQPLAKAACR
jgi:hypothetical protein